MGVVLMQDRIKFLKNETDGDRLKHCKMQLKMIKPKMIDI